MLRSVHIQNSRSCHDTSIDLDCPVTAIVGRNAVGKTNILKATAWPTTTLFSSTPPLADSAYEAPRWSSTALTLAAEGAIYEYRLGMPNLGELVAHNRPLQFKETLTLQDPTHNKRVLLERLGEEVKCADRPRFIKIGAATPAIPALLALFPEDDPLANTLRRFVTILGSIRYYDLNREIEQTPLISERQYREWRSGRPKEARTTRSVGMRLLHMSREKPELLQEFKGIIGPAGLGLLQDLRVESVPLPGFQMGTAGEQATAEKEDYTALQFFPTEGIGGAGRAFPFGDLSAGTQRVIDMVVSLLFDENSVMLVEQPEDCIHPGLLRKVLDLFRSYSDRTQLIFSTHSPAVLDMLQPEEIRLVTAPDGKTAVRALSPDEIRVARQFLQEEGALSAFYETLDES